MEAQTPANALTPPKIAKRLSVCTHQVHGWIRDGQLRAINTATNPDSDRPRWKVLPEDLEAFIEHRRVRPVDQPQRQRRRSRQSTQNYV